MKLNNFFSIILFLGILFIGCRDGKGSALIKIEKQFKECVKTVKGSDYIETPIYMIIPRAGCSSCISNAENFMLSSLKDSVKYRKLITFILTDFDSEKTLRARFGNLSSINIIIDKENIFSANKSLKSIYPTILFFDKEATLINVSESSPEKNGIVEIEKFISSKKE